MRNPRGGASMRALPMPDYRARRGREWEDLLLCELRARGGSFGPERPRLTIVSPHSRRSVPFRHAPDVAQPSRLRSLASETLAPSPTVYGREREVTESGSAVSRFFMTV